MDSLRTRYDNFLKTISRSRLIFSLIAVTTSIILLIIIIYLLNDQNGPGADFCLKFNPYCNKEEHTMCKYPTMKPGSACGRLDSYELSETDIEEILNAHNEFRKIVASGQEKRGKGGPQPAGIINPLKWDDDLAIIAQRLAIQCEMKHDKCRRIDRFSCGQNLAQAGYSNGYQSSLHSLVKMWYDEVEFYSPHDVQKLKFTEETGHYTQLVWGETTHVGCGVARYFHAKLFHTLLACNYGPAGNINDQPVYIARMHQVQLDSGIKILTHH